MTDGQANLNGGREGGAEAHGYHGKPPSGLWLIVAWVVLVGALIAGYYLAKSVE